MKNITLTCIFGIDPNKYDLNLIRHFFEHYRKMGIEKYEIAVLPHFVIGQLADSSVDLFYNSCSFSEMDAISAKEYLSIIERVCRRYFLHDNHDTVLKFRNHDGSTSVNVVGSELLPNSVLFKRIFKKPRVHGLPEDRSFIHFEYLYERVR